MELHQNLPRRIWHWLDNLPSTLLACICFWAWQLLSHAWQFLLLSCVYRTNPPMSSAALIFFDGYEVNAQFLTSVPYHSCKATCVKFGEDAKYIAVGSMDRNLRMFGLPEEDGPSESWPVSLGQIYYLHWRSELGSFVCNLYVSDSTIEIRILDISYWGKKWKLNRYEKLVFKKQFLGKLIFRIMINRG